jgi:polyferredoxin
VPLKRPWLHLLYLIYCAEAGVYLALVPWTVLWVPMAFTWPEAIRAIVVGGTARGAVSAFGVLMIVVCGVDLSRFCRALRAS